MSAVSLIKSKQREREREIERDPSDPKNPKTCWPKEGKVKQSIQTPHTIVGTKYIWKYIFKN